MSDQQRPTIPPYKLLRRPTDDRMIGGVCAGIGHYFAIDPNLVRVLFAMIAVLTWGTALIAYPVIWFIIPEERPITPGWVGPNAPMSPPHPPAAG